MRRISELVKRARAVKVHAYIIHYLRKQIAGWATVTVWDKTGKQVLNPKPQTLNPQTLILTP